jgi:hypothetical protein
MYKEIQEQINKIKNLNLLFNQKSSIKNYEEIAPNSFSGAIKLNGFSINKSNDPSATSTFFNNMRITESIDYVFEKKGGVINFSVNVNALTISKHRVINWVIKKIQTINNKLRKDTKINKILSKYEEIYGVTIGNFVSGRYKAKNGYLFNEDSLSIEIIGIDSIILNSVAEDLCYEFKQEAVLVKNYDSNTIYLVKND